MNNIILMILFLVLATIGVLLLRRILGFDGKQEMQEKKPETKNGNMFFTTVTVSDFSDENYINNLKKLDIGIELVLLTPLAGQLNVAKYDRDLEKLKQEIRDFIHVLSKFNIPLNQVRVHQPGGYAYDWFGANNLSGYDFLKDFFAFCYEAGFRNYVIHAPYGHLDVYQGVELSDYKAKIDNLFPADAQVNLEVEEISALHAESGARANIRLYNGQLFEKLMRGPRATVLLDVYECGGVDEMLKRLEHLKSEGFEIKTIHMHKDKHKFLTPDEVEVLVKANFLGNLVNEGFVKQESSFDEFVKTKSVECIVPNDKRIEILKSYIKQVECK